LNTAAILARQQAFQLAVAPCALATRQAALSVNRCGAHFRDLLGQRVLDGLDDGHVPSDAGFCSDA
jgi:hypothetical protein